MRSRVYVALALFVAPLITGAHQKLVLEADLARQQLGVQVVRSSVAAPPLQGGVDGASVQETPWRLTIESLSKSQSADRKGESRPIHYELRLQNTSNGPQKVPVNPNRSEVFHRCAGSIEKEATLFSKARRSVGNRFASTFHLVRV